MCWFCIHDLTALDRGIGTVERDPLEVGVADHVGIAIAEAGVGETAMLGEMVSSHLSSLGSGEVASRNTSSLTFSTMGSSGGLNIWGGTGLSFSGVGSSRVSAMSFGATAGVDLVNTGDITAGVGVLLLLSGLRTRRRRDDEEEDEDERSRS